MKAATLIRSVLPIFLIAAFLLISLVLKGGNHIMNQIEVLEKVAEKIENSKDLALESTDCKILFGTIAADDSKCYVSDIKPEEAVNISQKVLDEIGQTIGWREDYGVFGAFYSMRVDPQMSFGITVESAKDSLDFKNIKQITDRNSVVGITANSKRKPQ